MMKKFFAKLFSNEEPISNTSEQAILIHLDGTGLPREIYEEYDLSTLEDQLADVLGNEGLGEVDGNEVGEEGATIFLYGPDADKMFVAIELILQSYPLCRNAKVVLRYGAPGSPQRAVKIS